MLQLENYIDRARSEGAFQSEGEFTLSARESLSKLGRFQFDPPGLWLVKVVQCAVALGAPNVSIKVTRRNLQVSFPADLGLTARGLWEELVLPSPSQGRALRHLLSGLSALHGQRLKLSWLCKGSAGTSVLSWTRDGIQEWANEERGAGFELVAERAPVLGNSFYKRWLDWSVCELEAVRSRCWAAPIKIDLDGLKLDLNRPPGVRTLALWEIEAAESEAAGLFGMASPDFKPSCKIEGGYVSWNAVPGKNDFYLEKRVSLGHQNPPISGVLTLEHGGTGVSSIRYLLDGAVIDGPALGLSLPRDLRLHAYLPVKDLKVDLSQFRSQDERAENLLQVLPHMFAMTETIRGYLETPAEVAKGESNPTAEGVGSGLLTAAGFLKTGGLVFGAVGLPMGLLVGGTVLTARSMAKQQRSLERLDFTNGVRSLNRQLNNLQHKVRLNSSTLDRT